MSQSHNTFWNKSIMARKNQFVISLFNDGIAIITAIKIWVIGINHYRIHKT